MNTYTIIESRDGRRFVRLSPDFIIPASMAGCLADADAWVASIKLECQECGRMEEIRHMTGEGQWCSVCAIRGLDD